MKRPILLQFFACIFLMLCALSSAQQPRMDMFQVSTHPDVELSPRVSPDGRWVAYVSRQADNYDIWVVSTDGGRSRQITTNTADDFYPVWTPDNKSIVFVSQREDAAGDIWKINLREIKGRLFPKGDPKRLTDYIGFDGYPTVSPDNKKVAWVSDRSGRDEIWFYNDHTGNTLQLTFLGGTHPCWSPDLQLLAFTSFRDSTNSNGDIYIINLKGPKPALARSSLWDEREYPTYQVTNGVFVDGFPSWSPDADRLVFLRQTEDTNQDGRITPADLGEVWSADVAREPQKNPILLTGYDIDVESFNPFIVSGADRLTAGGQNCLQPWYGADKRIYMTSDRGGNPDIWSFPDSGPMPNLQTVEAQFEFALQTFSLSSRMNPANIGPLLKGWHPHSLTPSERQLLWDRSFAFGKVMDFEANDLQARALYQRALCFSLLGQDEKVKKQLETLYTEYPSFRLEQAFIEMLLLGNRYRSADSLSRTGLVEAGLRSIIDRFEEQAIPVIEALLQLAELYISEKEFDLAISAYDRIIEGYDIREKKSEALVRKARVYNKLGEKDLADQIYIEVIEKFADQPEWRAKARDALLSYSFPKSSFDQTIIAYRELAQQYRDLPFIGSSAQHKLADYLFNAGEYQKALIEFAHVEMQFPDQGDMVFSARLNQAESMINMGAYRQAFSYLDAYRTYYRSENPLFADSLKDYQTTAMLRVGDDLSRVNDFELAQTFYNRVIELAPQNIHAHRGLIECYYYQTKIDQAVAKYNKLAQENSSDKSILYAYGLALSYQGTEQADLGNDPDGFEPDLLHQSSNVIARALSYDYSMVDPYLTIAYNYEMQETYQNRQAAKPKNFFSRFVETVTAPVVALYRFFTFYDEKQPARYYERAVHELTKALALNDEHKNPKTEAILAMNLANNYYSLDEFGFERAYEYYHLKLKYDSTFTNIKREALIYERMGHCALVVEDLQRGPVYLQRAISLYQELNLPLYTLKNIKRLALLYETGQMHPAAIEMYQRAAEMENQLGRYYDLMKSYRNISYNYYRMGEPQKALNYGQQALRLLESGRIDPVKDKASRIKIGFLGLYFPVPFFDMNKMTAEHATSGYTTDDDRALLFTIMGKSYKEQSDFDEAIEYFNQKWRLYQKYDDPSVRATILNYIGYLYYLKGDYRISWQTFDRSREICEEHDIYDGIFTNTLNLGILVKSLNNKPQLLPDSLLERKNEWHENVVDLLDKGILKAQGVFGFDQAEIDMGLMLADLLIFDTNDRSLDQSVARLSGINDLARADELLQHCLDLSQGTGTLRQQCLIQYGLGRVSKMLKDNQSASSHLRRGRWMALTHGFTEYLWKIDLELADLANDSLIQDDNTTPFTYLEEAISVVENDTLVMSGMSSIDALWARTHVYDKMITHLKSPRNALGYAERKRSRLVLDLFSQERLMLEEPFQSLYDRAFELRSHIYRLRNLLLKGRYDQITTARQINQWNNELDQYNQEYLQIQLQIREQKPHLLPFITAVTVPLERIQSLLPADYAIIFMDWIDDLYIWHIDSESVKLDTLPIQNDLDDLFNDHDNTRELFQSKIQKGKRLCLIPPLSHLLAPWHTLFDSLQPVVVLSSLSAFSDMMSNNQSATNKVYTTHELNDPLWQDNGYTVINPVPKVTGNSFDAQVDGLRSASFIVIDGKVSWNKGAPLHSQFGYSIRRSRSAILSPLDWMRYSIPAFVVHFNIKSDLDWRQLGLEWLAWERAFVYSGVQNIILTDSVNPAENLSVFHSIYSALSDSQMSATLPHMPGRTAKIFATGIHSAGKFQGQQVRSLNTLVREGNRAYNNGDYTLAVRYYEQAQLIAENQSDQESFFNNTNNLFQTAVSAQMWDLAIRTQNRLEMLAREKKDPVARSLALHYLMHFYALEGEVEKRDQAYAQILSLPGSSEVLEQEARVAVNLGSIYRKSGQVEKSIKAYESAISWYDLNDRPEQSARMRLELGKIYWQDLEQYEKALDLFMAARQNANDNDVILKSILLTGDIWKDLNAWSLALEQYKILYQEAIALGHSERISAEQRLSELYLQFGLFERAEFHEKNALDVIDAADQRAGSDRLARILVEQQRYKEAQTLTEQRLELLRQGDDIDALSVTLNTLALIHGKQNVYPEALQVLHQAIEIDSSRSAMEYFERDLYHLAVIQIMNGLPEARNTINRLLARKTSSEFKVLLLAMHLAVLDNDENSFYQLQSRLESLLSDDKIDKNLQTRYYYYTAVNFKSQHADKPEQVLLRALEELVRLNTEFYTDPYDTFWAPTARQIFDALVLFYTQEEQNDKAWQIAHQAKQWSYRMQMKYNFLSLDSSKTLDSLYQEWILSNSSDSSFSIFDLPPDTPNPWNLRAVQLDEFQNILSSSVTFLDYYIIDNSVLLWEITREDIELKRITLPDDIDPETRLTKDPHQLLEILLDPVDNVDEIETLLINPDLWISKLYFSGYFVNDTQKAGPKTIFFASDLYSSSPQDIPSGQQSDIAFFSRTGQTDQVLQGYGKRLLDYFEQSGADVKRLDHERASQTSFLKTLGEFLIVDSRQNDSLAVQSSFSFTPDSLSDGYVSVGELFTRNNHNSILIVVDQNHAWQPPSIRDLASAWNGQGGSAVVVVQNMENSYPISLLLKRFIVQYKVSESVLQAWSAAQTDLIDLLGIYPSEWQGVHVYYPLVLGKKIN